MRVLFTSIRNASHFLPLVPFIDACRRVGHEVAVAAPPDLAPRVEATGATFFPFGHPGDQGLRPYWQRMRDVPQDEMHRIAVGEIFAGICAGTALPGLLEAMERWRPAIVVRESQEYAAVVAAQKLDIPHARVAISARGAEAEVAALAAPHVDVHRKSVGLPPDPNGERIRDENALTLFPPSFEGPDAALPTSSTPQSRTSRFRAVRAPAPPLPAWWGARREPFVYVTLGTVIGTMTELTQAYRVALDAVADLPVRVLLTTGAELSADALGPIPSNVHVERFVPQDQVIPHAAALLCHGGSGTVQGALSAGVPMVVAPVFADQPFNARCIAAAGAGLALPTATATAADARAALVRVLEEPGFRAAAERFAREIAALPAVDDAGPELERLARTPA